METNARQRKQHHKSSEADTVQNATARLDAEIMSSYFCATLPV